MQYKKSALIVVFFLVVLAACAPQSTQAAETATSAAIATETSLPTSQITTTSIPQQTGTVSTPGATMQVTPDSGTPGAKVQITGYLPGGPTASQAQNNDTLSHASICWDGCLGGFVEQNQAVEWSATDAGHFTISYEIPSIPWVGSKGIKPITPGDYSISLQCLGPEISGCALKEGSPSTTFHLQGPTSTECQSGQSCASLTFNPLEGPPDIPITISGWAPLVGIIGDTPVGYSFVILPPGGNQPAYDIGRIQQDLNGNISGSFTVPQLIHGVGLLDPGDYDFALQAFPSGPVPKTPIFIATTTFKIDPAPSWFLLSLNQPSYIYPSADLTSIPEITVDPGNNNRLAYCAPGSVQLSQDAGKTWTAISTQDIANVASQNGYPLMNTGSNEPASCESVTLDEAFPNSLYVVFSTYNPEYGAPPVYFMGFYSSDLGQTWTAVPPPPDETMENFGGFWTDGTGVVQALYNPQTHQSGQVPLPDISETRDGGKTWSQTVLVCPINGACIRWGPAPSQIPGMGSPLPQYVFSSVDGGVNWMVGPSVELRFPAPSELVIFPGKDAFVISGDGDYPLLLTDDGGDTWQPISLPPLPDNDNTGPLYSALQSGPDGSLLAMNTLGEWMILPQDEIAWCPIEPGKLPSQIMLFAYTSENLWWLAADGSGPQSLPIDILACAP
jgi:photosystem II stability/assembly factor-like uncharacterized protein